MKHWRGLLTSVRARSSWKLMVLALAGIALSSAAFAQSPPTIAKSFGSATVGINASVTLTFTITNPNPATDLTNVSFNDTLPPGLIFANPDSLVPDPVLGSCDPTGTTGTITPMVTSISLTGGQIPANATCTFSIDVLAISGGDQVNTTGSISSTEGGTGGTATATVTVLLPDLTIAKTHSGNFTQGQAGATYTITVTDAGADSNGSVTVTDSLPAALTATDISGPGWSCGAPPTLSCNRTDGLQAGTSFPDITVTVNVAANAPPTVTNTATVSGGGESNTSNDTATDITTVIQVADLTVSKTHSGNFTPGQTGATYTLTVRNIGPGPTVGTVTVTDTLPNVPNTLVPTAMAGTGWTCDLPSLTCTRSDALASGASYPAITLTVNVPAAIPANVTNTATVSGGGEINFANNTASDITHTGATIQFTLGNPNLQVVSGQVTSTNFTVDSTPGIGAITFACTNLPPGATCSFNPPSSALLSTPVQLVVTTTLQGRSLPPFGTNTPMFMLYAALLALSSIMLALLEILKHKRGLRRWALGMAVTGVLLAISACSGTAKNPRLGAFTITVTATSATGPSASASFNLTVLRPGPAD